MARKSLEDLIIKISSNMKDVFDDLDKLESGLRHAAGEIEIIAKKPVQFKGLSKGLKDSATEVKTYAKTVEDTVNGVLSTYDKLNKQKNDMLDKLITGGGFAKEVPIKLLTDEHLSKTLSGYREEFGRKLSNDLMSGTSMKKALVALPKVTSSNISAIVSEEIMNGLDVGKFGTDLKATLEKDFPDIGFASDKNDNLSQRAKLAEALAEARAEELRIDNALIVARKKIEEVRNAPPEIERDKNGLTKLINGIPRGTANGIKKAQLPTFRGLSAFMKQQEPKKALARVAKKLKLGIPGSSGTLGNIEPLQDIVVPKGNKKGPPKPSDEKLPMTGAFDKSLAAFTRQQRAMKFPAFAQIKKQMIKGGEFSRLESSLLGITGDATKADDAVNDLTNTFGVASTYVGEFDRRMRYLSRDLYIFGIAGQQISQQVSAGFMQIVEASGDLESIFDDVGWAGKDALEPVGDAIAEILEPMIPFVESLSDMFVLLAESGFGKFIGMLALGVTIFAKLGGVMLRYVGIFNLIKNSTLPMIRQQKLLNASQKDHIKQMINTGIQYKIAAKHIEVLKAAAGGDNAKLELLDEMSAKHIQQTRYEIGQLTRSWRDSGGDMSHALEAFMKGFDLADTKLGQFVQDNDTTQKAVLGTVTNMEAFRRSLYADISALENHRLEVNEDKSAIDEYKDTLKDLQLLVTGNKMPKPELADMYAEFVADMNKPVPNIFDEAGVSFTELAKDIQSFSVSIDQDIIRFDPSAFNDIKNRLANEMAGVTSEAMGDAVLTKGTLFGEDAMVSDTTLNMIKNLKKEYADANVAQVQQVTMLDKMKSGLKNTGKWLSNNKKLLYKMGKGAISAMIGMAGVNAIMEAAGPALEGIGSVVAAVLDPFTGFFEFLGEGFEWIADILESNPFIELMSVIATVGALISWLATGMVTFGGVIGGIATAISMASTYIPTILAGLGILALIKVIQVAWKVLTGKLTLQEVSADFTKWIKNITDRIGGWFDMWIDRIKEAIGWWRKLLGIENYHGAAASSGSLPTDDYSRKLGGPIDRTGLYNLHAGEYVIPANDVRAANGANNDVTNYITVTVVIDKSAGNLDERAIGRIVSEQIAKKMGRRL